MYRSIESKTGQLFFGWLLILPEIGRTLPRVYSILRVIWWSFAAGIHKHSSRTKFSFCWGRKYCRCCELQHEIYRFGAIDTVWCWMLVFSWRFRSLIETLALFSSRQWRGKCFIVWGKLRTAFLCFGKRCCAEKRGIHFLSDYSGFLISKWSLHDLIALVFAKVLNPKSSSASDQFVFFLPLNRFFLGMKFEMNVVCSTQRTVCFVISWGVVNTFPSEFGLGTRAV